MIHIFGSMYIKSIRVLTSSQIFVYIDFDHNQVMIMTVTTIYGNYSHNIFMFFY